MNLFECFILLSFWVKHTFHIHVARIHVKNYKLRNSRVPPAKILYEGFSPQNSKKIRISPPFVKLHPQFLCYCIHFPFVRENRQPFLKIWGFLFNYCKNTEKGTARTLSDEWETWKWVNRFATNGFKQRYWPLSFLVY